MPSTVKHFIRLLQVEILDLIDDIQGIEETLKKRYENQELSQYVYRENDALLNKEIESLQNFAKLVDGFDTSVYKDTASLAAGLLLRSKEIVQRYEDPQAVYIFLKRKIDKVLQYITSGNGISDCQ